ncbi:cysteine hydrolase family protein [Streptomyces caatingaensis]|uniref:Isochorismatase n=1 Tax=Streptomyces caatingaensis TaxID=1678637 RepID=A0A0K9XDR6_9ACTN|nr:isochorismatase family protein [Streptomyces caatingaensis]KNB51388.1 isochorismatase [Streptomyces caatingaensis]
MSNDKNTGNSVLLVIDVQESFRQRANWAATSNPDVVRNVGRLVDAQRAKGEPVVWILHSEPGSGTVFDPERGFNRPIEGLEPAAGEPVLTKTSHNAFTTTNLQQLLTQQGVHEVVISGIRTEQCCETTARVASDLGYDVTFVTDATATHPIEHRDAPAGRSLDEVLADPRTLTTDAIVARTEYALAGRFARIATTDDLTATD